jgi:hypothetical protein
MNTQINVGDKFEGVLLETIVDDIASRPRVRPLEYFGEDMRVEFPRQLRENNPIGTRFRADVKVSQKTKNNQPYGKPYLVASPDTIVKIEDFVPSKIVHAIKLNTASDRSYHYIEEEYKTKPIQVKFEDFRNKAYSYAVESPDKILVNSQFVIKRSEMIKTYALSRARGKCENCESDAPFLKRNGQPYLEVHHIKELGNNGSDSPLNVAAICPNCHARISHGIDGKEINEKLGQKIKFLEDLLNK